MLGVRGSTPEPGPDFVLSEEDASCVVVTPEGSDRPTLAPDAGTGLRSLTAMLGGQPYRGSILLSHLHWDHTQLFHDGPARTEDRLDAKLQELKSALPVTMAREGQVLEVAPE